MKSSRDEVVLNKILDYCGQIEDACNLFENDFEKFKTISVFHNACCMCILQTQRSLRMTFATDFRLGSAKRAPIGKRITKSA